jgi:hypothetical protein
MKGNEMRCLIFCTILAGSCALHARDVEMALEDVPAQYKDAVKKKFPLSTLVSAEKRIKGGNIVYIDLEVEAGNKRKDVYLDAQAVITATGEAITVGTLPREVRKAVESSFPKWRPVEAEKAQDFKTQAISYCIDLVKEGKKIEVEFDSSGKLLSQEELRDDD